MLQGATDDINPVRTTSKNTTVPCFGQILKLDQNHPCEVIVQSQEIITAICVM